MDKDTAAALVDLQARGRLLATQLLAAQRVAIGVPYPGEVIQGNFADVPPFVLAEVDGHIPLPHIAHGRHFPCQKTLG